MGGGGGGQCCPAHASVEYALCALNCRRRCWRPSSISPRTTAAYLQALATAARCSSSGGPSRRAISSGGGAQQQTTRSAKCPVPGGFRSAPSQLTPMFCGACLSFGSCYSRRPAPRCCCDAAQLRCQAKCDWQGALRQCLCTVHHLFAVARASRGAAFTVECLVAGSPDPPPRAVASA